MKNKSEHWNRKAAPGKERPTEPDPNTQPRKFPQPEPTHEPPKPWANPYPDFPAIDEGKPGSVYISCIVVYYSLN